MWDSPDKEAGNEGSGEGLNIETRNQNVCRVYHVRLISLGA